MEEEDAELVWDIKPDGTLQHRSRFLKSWLHPLANAAKKTILAKNDFGHANSAVAC